MFFFFCLKEKEKGGAGKCAPSVQAEIPNFEKLEKTLEANFGEVNMEVCDECENSCANQRKEEYFESVVADELDF